jgi:hypothetical protein
MAGARDGTSERSRRSTIANTSSKNAAEHGVSSPGQSRWGIHHKPNIGESQPLGPSVRFEPGSEPIRAGAVIGLEQL